MDQNNTNVDDALQQAINEITNSSAEQQNPFADPVAGPADLGAPEAPAMTGPVEAPYTIPEPATAPAPEMMPAGDFVETPIDGAPSLSDTPNDLATTGVTVASGLTGEQAAIAGDLKAIQDEALHELVPMLGELSEIDASEKDGLYRRAYEYSHDPAVLNEALANAKTIADPKERAAALLYIVKAN